MLCFTLTFSNSSVVRTFC